MIHTQLFTAIHSADQVVVNGYEIDYYNFRGESQTWVLSCDDEIEYTFKDQPVQIDPDGDSYGFVDALVRQQGRSDDEPIKVIMSFSMIKPITVDDLV